jgi:hypothetical protein
VNLVASGMASPDPPTRRAAHDTSNIGSLTQDGLYKVLFLRAVCRPWRALLSDPDYATAHAAQHHSELLFLTSYTTRMEHDDLVDVLDASWHVMKRVRRNEGEMVVSMTSDVVSMKMIQEVNPLPRRSLKQHGSLTNPSHRRFIPLLLCLAVVGGSRWPTCWPTELLPRRVVAGLLPSFMAMETGPAGNTPWQWFELGGGIDDGSMVGSLVPCINR